MSQNKSSEPERSAISITRGVDLRALRAVVAVADAGSFRRAAVLLGYTQSAVSHQISGLEMQLQAPLFTRPGGRGRVTLTPAGEAAYARARRALAEVETLSVDVYAAHRGDRATLRVGVFQTVASELLPGALRALREERPGLEVILSEVDDSEVANNLIADGRLDLALSINPVPDDRVHAIALLEDRWVILARRDNPMLELTQPNFDLLDGTEMVAWTRRWPAQLELEHTWRRRGITPRIVYRTDDNLALQRLVAAGLGVACISRLAAQRAVEPSLTWLEPHEILTPRVIALCHPRHRDASAPALSLINAIRAQVGA
jgi:DNA-binding transcriptional LysR family regulator